MAENAATSEVDLASQDTTPPEAAAPATAPKARSIHKVGEVNISAYFQVEMKESLRMVQAKTGNSVKNCLAEALCDLFRKHNVPVPADKGEPSKDSSQPT